MKKCLELTDDQGDNILREVRMKCRYGIGSVLEVLWEHRSDLSERSQLRLLRG